MDVSICAFESELNFGSLKIYESLRSMKGGFTLFFSVQEENELFLEKDKLRIASFSI